VNRDAEVLTTKDETLTRMAESALSNFAHRRRAGSVSGAGMDARGAQSDPPERADCDAPTFVSG